MNVLAVDAGTTAVKAAVVDSSGDVTRVARVAVKRHERGGIDPESYWAAVAEAIADTFGLAAEIDAVTVTGQGDGLWTLSDQGAPAGDAFEWNSTQPAEIVAAWERDGTIAEHYGRSGTVLWPGTTAALWRWACDHQPLLTADTRHVFYAKDWINYRLCGAIATDITDATIPFLNLASGHYDAETFSFLGCADLLGAMAPIVPSGTEIGVVSADAADRTGLSAGTPVLMGCIDVAAMIRGVGVNEPGGAVAVLGTTAATMTVTDSLDTSGEAVGATLRIHHSDQQYLRVMGTSSGTSTLDWFLAEFYGSPASGYDEFWADARAGRPGVVMLPYLAGERAPFLAPEATGTFIGLTNRTNKADIARSVALGITFSLRHCLEHATSGALGSVVLTGGGAASRQWCQLAADVLGITVIVDDRPHVACAGAAAIATGRTLAPPAERTTLEPQDSYHGGYREFVDIGQAIRPIWTEMNRQ